MSGSYPEGVNEWENHTGNDLDEQVFKLAEQAVQRQRRFWWLRGFVQPLLGGLTVGMVSTVVGWGWQHHVMAVLIPATFASVTALAGLYLIILLRR